MIKLTAKQYNALAVIPPKKGKDVRYYLEGIYYDAKEHRTISTDGRRMLVIDVSHQPDLPKESFIFNLPDKKAPVKSSVEINPVSDTETEIVFLPNKKEPIDFLVKNITGKYPNWKQVVDASFVESKQDRISFDSLLVADVQKALGASGVTFHFNKNDGAMHVEFVKCDENIEHFLLMPMRSQS